MRSDRKGFTLIELLVVIAIIAILAAILFPVFARAQATARSTQCLSNLKQLGSAITMYKDDYDAAYPCINPTTASSYGDSLGELYTGAEMRMDSRMATKNYITKYSVRAQLDPYLKSMKVWACPSDTDVSPDFVVGKVVVSYCYRHNIGCFLMYPGSYSFDAFTDANFPKPSGTVVYHENSAWHWAGGNRADWNLVSAGGKGTLNCAFIDGHVAKAVANKTFPWDSVRSDRYDPHWFRNGDATRTTFWDLD